MTAVHAKRGALVGDTFVLAEEGRSDEGLKVGGTENYVCQKCKLSPKMKLKAVLG